jgi:hypothetical protein
MANFVHVIPAFVLTALLLAIVPGQTVAMILRQAIIGGTKTAYTTLLGTSTALIFWGAASAIGLSQIFAHSPTAYSALKYAGVAFLTFLALQTLWSLRHEFGQFDYVGCYRHARSGRVCVTSTSQLQLHSISRCHVAIGTHIHEFRPNRQHETVYTISKRESLDKQYVNLFFPLSIQTHSRRNKPPDRVFKSILAYSIHWKVLDKRKYMAFR